MILTIDEIKSRITPIAEKYKLRAVYVFGSYARNEATAGSDVDVLVDIEDSAVKGMIIGGLYNDLCESLGENTDLITVGALTHDGEQDQTPWFTENVMRERVLLYERR